MIDFDFNAANAVAERKTKAITIETSSNGLYKKIPEGVSCKNGELIRKNRRNYNPLYGGVHSRLLCYGFQGR